MKRMQRGMTMLGFLITLSVVILFLFCGMKIVPMYIEFYSVQKALKSIASEQSAGATSKDAIRGLFARHIKIDYVKVIKPEMLKIDSTAEGYNLSVTYERREELIANLDVVGRFHAEQALVRGAGAQ